MAAGLFGLMAFEAGIMYGVMGWCCLGMVDMVVWLSLLSAQGLLKWDKHLFKDEKKKVYSTSQGVSIRSLSSTLCGVQRPQHEANNPVLAKFIPFMQALQCYSAIIRHPSS